MVILFGLIILGSLIPSVDVTHVILLSNSTSVQGQNLTTLNGFHATANSTYSYMISITNPTYYNESITRLKMLTKNFSLINTTPTVPFIIKPNSTENLTLNIKLPNYAYNNSIELEEIYAFKHIYYKYNSYNKINITNNNETLIIKANTNTSSNVSILTIPQHDNFTSNKPYSTVYSKNINSSSIISINHLVRGSYYILMQSNSSNSTFVYETTKPVFTNTTIGAGSLNFSLKNVSLQ